jgi:Sulfotransferase domain
VADEVARLAMWSGPRNISTALMRSWEHRPDTVVVDEPLYAHYLATTGIDHPGREEIITSMPTDIGAAIAGLLAPVPDGIRVFYQKQMTHHLIDDVPRGWIAELVNVLLIRDPAEVVASYMKSRSEVNLLDIGLPQQVSLYDDLMAAGRPPLVLDSADFLREPAVYLRGLCDLVGVEFSAAMLHWPVGRRDSDGVWGPYWYDAVWRSTGFEPYRRRSVELTGRAAQVAEQAGPLYARLAAHRWHPVAGAGAGGSIGG